MALYNPQEKINLRNQDLAELSLETIDDQYPLTIELRNSIKNTILGQKKVLEPTLTLSPKSDISELFLNQYSFEPGSNINDIFRVGKLISSGTVQGTVFKADILPNSQWVAISGNKEGDNPIPSIMKKSAIVNTQTWMHYILGNYLYDTIVLKGELVPNPIQISKFADLIHFSLRVPEIFNADSLKKWKQTVSPVLENQIFAQYLDPNNDAYVDALGGYIASVLAESGISAYYPLLYGTIRAFDSDFFSEKDYGVMAPILNQNFPVEVEFIQPLKGTVDSLIGTKKSDTWFNNEEKLKSLFAQMVFGKSQGQKLFGFVHNDLHVANVMWEGVDPKTFIYYKKRKNPPGSANEFDYYAIPTLGKVYKEIDFGRSYSCKISDFCFGSTVPQKFYGDYDSSNLSNDMIRFVFSFYEILPDDLLRDPWISSFMNQIFTCQDTAKTDVRKKFVSCKGDYQCEDDIIYGYPFLKSSNCTGASSEDLIPFFDSYKVNVSDIPKGAKIYTA